MAGRAATPEHRGGGDPARTDRFRYAPGRSGLLAIAAIAALGGFGIAAAAFDLGGAQASGAALWLGPGGAVLLLAMAGLFWLARRRPVLLIIGPVGLDTPAALAHPVAWRDIWRIRRTPWRVSFWQRLVILTVDLAPGIRPLYKRRPWTWPAVDAWIARKYGLFVPIHNLDAPEDVILASIERFKPVQRVAT